MLFIVVPELCSSDSSRCNLNLEVKMFSVFAALSLSGTQFQALIQDDTKYNLDFSFATWGRTNLCAICRLGVNNSETILGAYPCATFHMKTAFLNMTWWLNGSILRCLNNGSVWSYMVFENEMILIAFFSFFSIGSRVDLLVQDQFNML